MVYCCWLSLFAILEVLWQLLHWVSTINSPDHIYLPYICRNNLFSHLIAGSMNIQNWNIYITIPSDSRSSFVGAGYQHIFHCRVMYDFCLRFFFYLCFVTKIVTDQMISKTVPLNQLTRSCFQLLDRQISTTALQTQKQWAIANLPHQ